MKNFIFIILASLMIVSCTNQKTDYNLSVELEGIEEGKFLLLQRSSGNWITLDSVDINNTAIVFSGKIESPEIYYIQLQGTRKYIPVFMEASDIVLSGHIDSIRKVKIVGSVVQDEYDEFGNLTKQYDDQLGEIYKEYREARKAEDDVKLKELETQMDKIQEVKNVIVLDYITSNGNSVVTAYIANRNHYNYELEDLEKIVSSYSEKVKSSAYGKILVDKVVVLRTVAIGKQFIDFSMADPDGNTIALSSLVGEKVLLIDFWAAWCGPCRAENPNVVAVYNDYKDKGFDVFGVSLDTDKERWLKAIEDDNLTWSHVSDLIGWKNAASVLYGVSSIPHSVLIDKNGTIIAKNLRGDDLRNKISKLLD